MNNNVTRRQQTQAVGATFTVAQDSRQQQMQVDRNKTGAARPLCCRLLSAVCRLLSAIVLLTLLTCGTLTAAERTEHVEKIRELFVPEKHFGELFRDNTDRTVLSREEYESLVLEARQIRLAVEAEARNAQKPAPVDFVWTTGKYHITVSGDRAIIDGELELEIFREGLIAIPLQTKSVAVRGAMFNDTPARVGSALLGSARIGSEVKDDLNVFTLFAQGKGRHTLRLQMTTALAIDSTQQELQFRVPRVPQMKLTLDVPGDVSMKSGGAVLARIVEGEGLNRKTRFELFDLAESFHWSLTLNSLRTRATRTVLARSVQFSELTEMYERLHATVTLDALHQAISQCQFVLPAGFEVTDIHSPMLARWGMDSRDNTESNGDAKILTVDFREPVMGQCRLEITALRTLPASESIFGEWRFSPIRALDVASDTAVVGLLAERRFGVGDLRMQRLIPIEASSLKDAIPTSAFETMPGMPSLQLIAAWYAPLSDWELSGRIIRHESEFETVANLLLTLHEQKQTASGTFTIQLRGDKLFSASLATPEHWFVTNVFGSDNQPIPFERRTMDGKSFIQLRFPHGLEPGGSYAIRFAANGVISSPLHPWGERVRVRGDGSGERGIPGNEASPHPSPLPVGEGTVVRDSGEKTADFDFPAFRLTGATRETGTITVVADEDMLLIPKEMAGLIPLENVSEARSQKQGTFFAYRFLHGDYALSLTAEQAKSRIKARVYSCYKIEPSLLSVYYELAFQVDEARVDSLSFLLPADVTDRPSIRGLGGLRIKETNSELISPHPHQKVSQEGEGTKMLRRWTVQLAEPMRGELRLAVQLDVPIVETADGRRQTAADASDVGAGLVPAQMVDGDTVGANNHLPLPAITAANVAWQSAIVSVEGHEELDVQIVGGGEGLRPVDVGELSNTGYQPGKRLLGVYSRETTEETLLVTMSRNAVFTLTPSLVRLAQGLATLGQDGRILYEINYTLKTNAAFIRIDLTENEQLWSVRLDGTTIRPQRSESHVLVDVPANNTTPERRLQIVFSEKRPQTSFRTGTLVSTVQVRVPELLIPSEQANASNTLVLAKIPVAQIAWQLRAPLGHRLADTAASTPPRPALLDFMMALPDLLRLPLYEARSERNLGVYSSGMTLPEPQYYRRSLPYYSRTLDESGQSYNFADSYESQPSYMLGHSDNKERRTLFSRLDADSLSERSRRPLSSTARYPVSMSMPMEEAEAPALISPQLPASSFERSSELRSGRVTVGLGAPGDFNTDDSVPVQQDSFGAPVTMFGSTAYPTSAPPPPPPTAEPRIMRLESVQPVSVNLIGFSDRQRLSRGSIGDELATLQVRVVRSTWFAIAEWGMFCTFLGMGLAMLRGSRQCRTRFVLLTVLAGTILVLIPGLELFGDAINAAVFAVLTVVLPVYLLIAFGGVLHRWLARFTMKKHVVAIVAIIVIALTCLFALRAMAGDEQRSQEFGVSFAAQLPRREKSHLTVGASNCQSFGSVRAVPLVRFGEISPFTPAESAPKNEGVK